MIDIRKDDIQEILSLLPDHLVEIINEHDLSKLIEVVLDLGRIPEARFSKKKTIVLGNRNVTREVLNEVVSNLGQFSDNNRAGLEGTLHRISCIRSRTGEIVGLTMRIGRSIFGSIEIMKDQVDGEKSVLLLGPPGVGKTTMLREIAHYLSTEKEKRVVIIDTSNEIAGDGDVPHPGIGRARRMQVPREKKQHDVMIEAVENHMPEVIIVDEIGTEEEAEAARTIAERGVTLIGTAHGNDLENLIQNPTLSDLIGGIETVTLGDEEAKKRGTRKTVLERGSRPTFDICVEIVDRYTVNIHKNVANSVDGVLRGWTIQPELRSRDKATDEVKILEPARDPSEPEKFEGTPYAKNGEAIAIYPYAISKSLLKRAFAVVDFEFEAVNTIEEADLILALKSYAQPDSTIFQISAEKGIEIKIVEDNSLPNITEALEDVIADIPYMEQNWDKIVPVNASQN